MRLRTLSFHIAAGLALPLLAAPPLQAPHFTAKEAVRAEWMRTPPALSADDVAKLPPADRVRYERTVARIGRPGAPLLLPTELDHPTQGQWAQKAEEAKTPRERFDALFFLNRFKDKEALKALDGLTPADAKAWPKHLHLEAQIATARLNGGEVSPALRTFLDALQKEGKVDPVRAQAARLRLMMAGKEKELLSPVEAGPGAQLALLDAWQRAPWEQRKSDYQRLAHTQEFWVSGKLSATEKNAWSLVGLKPPTGGQWQRAWNGTMSRLIEDLPNPAPEELKSFAGDAMDGATVESTSLQTELACLAAIAKFASNKGEDFKGYYLDESEKPLLLEASVALPSMRATNPKAADALRTTLLSCTSAIARAAAIEDLPTPPADLDALTKRTWADDQFESQQTLIQSYARWKMPPEEQKAQLRPWLQHPNWSCRFEAYQALRKLDPSTLWPEAPKPSATEEKILQEAERLAQQGRPLRLEITFGPNFPASKRARAEHPRIITLRLDPTVAPINVANLELLAKKHFFDGHLVPRVVPDFVVQMGSPFDTMDGGPGYTVRCEDSLDWYGPGSVGMALAGKDTGGCQFFITTNATPHLTGKYTRVGQVENLDRAMKVLDDLELGARIESIRVLP